MNEFKSPTLLDKPWVDDILNDSYAPSLEYNFSTIFMWKEVYNTKIKKFKDCFLVCFGDKMDKFLFPIGKSSVLDAFDWIIKNSSDELSFLSVTREQREIIKKNYGNDFEFMINRNASDYIYKTENLAYLKGKKLSSKRNHINRFLQNNPDWKYIDMTPDNLHLARDIQKIWEEKNCEYFSKGLEDEKKALITAFDNFKELGLSGGILIAKDGPVAFSIGEKLNQNTFIVHFEKAFYDVQGAYPMINKQFVLNNCMDYEFVNREEDAGDEGLRKAKLSYNPHIILEKFDIRKIKK